MQLIEYTLPNKWKVIKEAAENGVRKLKLTGTAGRVNEANKNKRVYPEKVLKNAIGALQEKITNRELIGALDHPTNTNNMLSQASHLITKLWLDNNEVLWEAEVLPTPSGKILSDLIEANVRVGISSRGEGSLVQNDDGTSTVAEDYRLVTFDVVADPSTRGAYASLSESIENKKKIDTIYESAKKDVNANVFLNILKNKIDEKLDEWMEDGDERWRGGGKGSAYRKDLRAQQKADKSETPETKHGKAIPGYKMNTQTAKMRSQDRIKKLKSEPKPNLPESLTYDSYLDMIIESLETRGFPAKFNKSTAWKKKATKKVGRKIAKGIAKGKLPPNTGKAMSANESILEGIVKKLNKAAKTKWQRKQGKGNLRSGRKQSEMPSALGFANEFSKQARKSKTNKEGFKNAAKNMLKLSKKEPKPKIP